jgi:hypothetical protein
MRAFISFFIGLGRRRVRRRSGSAGAGAPWKKAKRASRCASPGVRGAKILFLAPLRDF